MNKCKHDSRYRQWEFIDTYKNNDVFFGSVKKTNKITQKLTLEFVIYTEYLKNNQALSDNNIYWGFII